MLAADELGDRVDLVRHRGGEHDADAERLEPLGEPDRVRVLDVAADDFVADREDRGEHRSSVPTYAVSSPRRAHIPGRRTSSEAGANPALSRNCDASQATTREDEPGRLPTPDERQPSEEGRFAVTAAEPTSSAHAEVFYGHKKEARGTRPRARVSSSSRRTRPRRTSRSRSRRRAARSRSTRSRCGSSRSRRPRPRCSSRSAPGKQVVAVDDQSNYPAKAPRTKLSGFTPNVEAIANVQARPRRRRGRAHEARRRVRKAVGIPLLVEPSAPSLADAYTQIAELGKATGHRARRRRARRADEGADRGDREDACRRAASRSTVYHELDPTYYSATSKTFIGRVYTLLGLQQHRRRGRQDGLGLPAALGRVHRLGEPDADRPRRHEVLRPDGGDRRQARRLEHDRGGEGRRRGRRRATTSRRAGGRGSWTSCG